MNYEEEYIKLYGDIDTIDYHGTYYRFDYVEFLESRLRDMEWINVKDRLPDKQCEYMVWPSPNIDLHIRSAVFDIKNKLWRQDFYNGYDYEDFYPDITHWMPLLDPPKKIDGGK